MDRAGAMELIMPMVQPAELWDETGRWDKMGDELLRFRTATRATSRCSPPPRKSSPTSHARS